MAWIKPWNVQSMREGLPGMVLWGTVYGQGTTYSALDGPEEPPIRSRWEERLGGGDGWWAIVTF